MNNVTELSHEKTIESSSSVVTSPFQLNKSKPPIKLIPLHAVHEGETSSPSGHGTASLSDSCSPTSSTSSIGASPGTGDVMSQRLGLGENPCPRLSLGENPFTLKLDKAGGGGSTTLSRSASMTNSVFSESHRIVDLQKEILKLKKDLEMRNIEMESKEAKLSSSVKSIKQFWSPELKKERGLRKEESERCKLLEQQLLAANAKCMETTGKFQEYQSSLREVLTADGVEEGEEEEGTMQQQLEKLKTQIKNLQKSQVTLTETNKNLYHESDKKSSKIAKLEKSIREQEKVIEEKEKKEKEEAENSILSHRDRKLHIEGLKEEIVLLNQSVAGHKSQVQLLEEELSSEKEKVLAARQEADESKQTLSSTLMRMELEFNTKVEECNQLREELGCAKEKIVETENLLETSRGEHSEVMKQKDNEVHILKQEMMQKEDDAEKLQLELNCCQETMVKTEHLLETNRNEHLQEMEEKEKEANRLRRELDALTLQRGEQRRQSEADARNQNMYEEQIRMLKESLKQTEHSLELTKEEYRSRLMEAQQRYDEKQQDYNRLQNEEEKLDGEIKKLEGKIDSILTANEVTESTLRALECEEKQLRRTLETNEANVVEERREHEEERKRLLHQTTRAQQELLDSQEKMRTLLSQNTDLQSQLKKAQVAVTASDAAAKEVQDLTAKYNTLNKFLNERQQALNTSCDEVRELRLANENLTTALQLVKQTKLEDEHNIQKLKDQNKEYLNTLEEKGKEEAVRLKQKEEEYYRTILLKEGDHSNILEQKEKDHANALKQKEKEFASILRQHEDEQTQILLRKEKEHAQTVQAKEKEHNAVLRQKEQEYDTALQKKEKEHFHAVEMKEQQQTSRIEQLKQRNDELSKRCDEAREKHEEYVKIVNELRGKEAEHTATINALNRKNEEVVRTSTALQEQSKSSSMSNDKWKEKNADNLLKIRDLEGKIDDLTSALGKQKEKVDELMTSVDQWKEKDQQSISSINKWKEKNGESILTIKELTMANDKLTSTINELTSTNNELTLTNNELLSTNKQLTSTNKELEERVTLSNHTIQNLTEKSKHYVAANDELKSKNEECRVENEELGKQLSEQKILFDELQQEKCKLKKENDELVAVASYERLKLKFEGRTEGQDGETIDAFPTVDDLKMAREVVEEEEIKLLEFAREEQQQPETDGTEDLEIEDDDVGRDEDYNIFDSPSFTPDRTPSESESECSMEQTRMRKVQKTNDQLHKEIAFLKLKISSIEKQKGSSVVVMDDRPVGVTKKYVWDELSKKDSRIVELERLLKEKAKQLSAMKDRLNNNKPKEDAAVDEQMLKLKADIDQRVNRISLLEDTLREMVGLAKKRENIMARYAEVYEEVQNRYEEADREYSRICFERNITNIKNALLILIICEREALISAMKVSQRSDGEELFTFRQGRLMTSISELDTQIAHLESHSGKTKRAEINRLKQEKEQCSLQLKHLDQERMLKFSEDTKYCITNELRTASPEEVYEAVRHISNTYQLLESKIEELMTFLRERNADLLKDISDVPIKDRDCRSDEEMINLPKEELMKELSDMEEHSCNLQKFVENLLTLIEGDC